MTLALYMLMGALYYIANLMFNPKLQTFLREERDNLSKAQFITATVTSIVICLFVWPLLAVIKIFRAIVA